MTNPKVMIMISTRIVGGPGKGVLQLLDRFPSRGIEYLLVTDKRMGTLDTEFIKLIKEKKLNIEILEYTRTFDPILFKVSRYLVKKYGINIIQSHGYKSHLIALYIHLVEKTKWITFIHGWSAEDFKMRLYSVFEVVMVRFSDVVIAVSPSIKKVLSRWHVGGIHTILNAVDKNEIYGLMGGYELRRKLNISDSAFVIGVIGRLSPEKGHKYLLEAIARIRHKGIRLLIIGDGPLKDELEKLSNELGLNDTVTFCGHSQNIRDYYEAINLLVLPSLKEGLPNVVLEAMVMNIPVISTDVGGVREIITDDYNGWIIEAGNVNSIAHKLNEIIEDRKRLAIVATRLHDSIFPKFCPDRRADEVVKVYKSLLV